MKKKLLLNAITLVVLSQVHSTGLAQSAAKLIRQGDFRGGVAVVAGCGGGSLAVEILKLAPNCLVHGLSTDEAELASARAQSFDADVSGRLSFGAWDGATIPFVDSFVNLLVIGQGEKVARDEILRVLAPGGTAVTMGSGERIVKPRPGNIDEWTHYLHNPSNNAVSRDKAIRPPLSHLQWVGGPRWSRHHDVMSSFSACVSADNKVFYIFDEGMTFSPMLPCEWKLIARDAFNGVVLWKLDIPDWFPNLLALKSGPASLPRRLVAAGKRVYATLGIEAPVSEIDSDSGKVLRVLTGTEGTEEILLDQGMLFLVADRNPEKAELATSPVPGTKAPVVREKVLAAFDLNQGRILWEETFPWIAPIATGIDRDQVYLYDGEKVCAVSRQDGKKRWGSEPLPLRKIFNFNFGPRLVVANGTVIYTGGENAKDAKAPSSDENMYGLSARTGEKLWEAHHAGSGYRSPEDLFVIGDKVWSGNTAKGSPKAGQITAVNLADGEQLQEFVPDQQAYWFHHRCYPAKATEDFLLTSRTGIEFIDLKTEHWTLHHWVRGACLYGIIPANGLIYAPQHPCACYLGAKLYGLNAVRPSNPGSPAAAPTPDAERLTHGVSAPGGFDLNNAHVGEWPTYRGDNRRSGAIAGSVPETMGELWSVELSGDPTPPVIAGGKVLVSLKDRPAVYAFDAQSGEMAFRYLPSGRVDSPPTVYANRVYFGSTDGHVYCLNLTDGSLVWKYQAAPSPARHMFFEHIESTHPLHGSVLIRDGKIYAAAGRSMFLDGGMRMLILNAETGEKIAEHVMDDKKPGTDEELQMDHRRLTMPIAAPDILSSSGDKLFMGFQPFDFDGKRLGNAMGENAKDWENRNAEDQKGDDAHLFSPTGFLDDSWWHRTYWMFGKHHVSGWDAYYLAGKNAPAGRAIVFDDSGIYGWGRTKQYFRWSKPYQYMLFSYDYDYQENWARSVPILVRAMAKAGDSLMILGPKEIVDQEKAFKTIATQQTHKMAARQAKVLAGKEGSMLLEVDSATGDLRRGYKLPSVPVMDGLAVQGGRLFVSRADGVLSSLGSGGKPVEEIARDSIKDFNAEAALPEPPKGKKGKAKGKGKKEPKKKAKNKG